MDKKIVFVNATSATFGGTLSILNQFVDEIVRTADKYKKYYIFVPISSNFKSNDLIEFIKVKAKKYLDRIKWDIHGIKNWSKHMNINPSLIISLQNTGVLFKKVPQIIYLHQSLSYAKEAKWSIFKKYERTLWFYKYLYKVWIDLTIRKDHYIIIQSKWMKEVLIRTGYLENKIIISRPSIKEIKIDEVKEIDKENKKLFFYPAANYKYKNHDLILEVLKGLKSTNENLANEIKVVFTLDKNCSIYEKIINYELEDIVENIGQIEYEEVLRYYKSCDALFFPSYIESVGLPLLEASKFHKEILVSDCLYSREVLSGYDRVEFLDYKNLEIWHRAINRQIYKDKELSIKVKEKEVKEKEVKEIDGWNNMFILINKVS